MEDPGEAQIPGKQPGNQGSYEENPLTQEK